MTVVHRTCLGKCCTSNYNRAREFEVYRFLFTHNLQRTIRTKGNRTIKRNAISVYVCKKRNKKDRKREKESQLDLSIFHVLFIYIILLHGKRVHLHGNSSRCSPWKWDAYKSTTPFHARKKIKVFIPEHKLWLKKEKERNCLTKFLNKYIRIFYAGFFSKDCVWTFNNSLLDSIVHEVHEVLPRARTDAIISMTTAQDF